MTVATLTSLQNAYAPPLDRAIGQTAGILRTIFSYAPDSDSTVTQGYRGQMVTQALRDAVAQAYSESWDGYGAEPIEPSTLAHGLAFLRLLSSSIPVPGIAVDVDGDLAVEWDYGPRRVLSIRVANDGTLNYAGILGQSIFHGVEPSRETVPATVVVAIQRIVAAAGP